jgi:hypothetical protein
MTKENPSLKAETDALFVGCDKQLSQYTLPNPNGLTPQQVFLLGRLAIYGFIYEKILATHPDLKAKADSLYVQFEPQVTAAMTNASSGNQ